MIPPLPVVISFAVSAALVVVGVSLLRLLFAPLLQGARVRAALGLLCAVIALAHAAWATGERSYTLSLAGAVVASILLPLLALVVASLPVAAIVRAVAARLLGVRRRAGLAQGRSGVTRRAILASATVAVPALALGTGFAGFTGGASATLLRRLPMRFADLPLALQGFRILQLSDLHLGCTKRINDLERFFGGLAETPDLLVLTGDIAEDVSLLAPALRLAADLRPRYGALAVLGNHEYLRDIRVTRPIFERGPIPLLVNAGQSLLVAGACLHVSGVDDPITVGRPIDAFLERAVDRALDGAPSQAFHLLLSHRPEGFDPAAGRGIDLTLSGHTHGGQIGFNQKSAFEPLYPDGYLWGPYARGRSRLYTTSGFGDWYPFRLGCPAEAAMIVLERG